MKLKSILILVLTLINLFHNSTYAEEVLKGKVIGIRDGDTIEVLVSKKPYIIRLYAIDSPERSQAFGQKAKAHTSELAFNKNISVFILYKDKYQRYVAKVFLPDGKDLSRELVRDGYAWWYKYFAPNLKEFEKLERSAKDAKLGLWQEASPTPPWAFRKNSPKKG